MKKLKFKIKGWLLVKLAKARRETRIYKDKLAESVLKEQEYIDKINLMQDDVRQLLLKLDAPDRELWLKKEGREYARFTTKKERVKNKIKSIKNN